MTNLLIFNTDDRPFSVASIRHVFLSEPGFGDVRYNTPADTPIEADYSVDQDSTIVRLSDDLETISLSGTTDAALHAAMILRKHLEGPLQIIDTDYSFDLLLSDFADIEALRTAIDDAQSS